MDHENKIGVLSKRVDRAHNDIDQADPESPEATEALQRYEEATEELSDWEVAAPRLERLDDQIGKLDCQVTATRELQRRSTHAPTYMAKVAGMFAFAGIVLTLFRPEVLWITIGTGMAILATLGCVLWIARTRASYAEDVGQMQARRDDLSMQRDTLTPPDR